MRPRTRALLLSTLTSCALAFAGHAQQTSPLTAAEIMARVAANQDRAETERAHFVYVQHASVQSRKGHTIMCQEITDTRVTPTPEGSTRNLLTLDGHVHDGDRTVHYATRPEDNKNQNNDDTNVNIGDKETVLNADANNAPVQVSDTDIDLVENSRRNFTSDKKSKDGMLAGLFPFTTEQQKDKVFVLKGQEPMNGHQTFHIVFHPKDKEDYDWKGDAWIDTTAFQPVLVRTALSRKLPFAVRGLLGTNVPGLGFTATYAPQANDIWFPASFGTEFKIKLFFFFEREIVVGVTNRDFEQTHVNSRILGEATE